MRSDLKAIEGITDIVTDVDEKTCQFKIDGKTDVQAMLDELAEKNDKVKDWEFVQTPGKVGA